VYSYSMILYGDPGRLLSQGASPKQSKESLRRSRAEASREKFWKIQCPSTFTI
jgi:hypothetical protein